jgi:hypothetical protein
MPMTQIVIDADLLGRLNGLKGPAELCDESGRLLGHFVPAVDEPIRPEPGDGCPFTPEELERFRHEEGGMPLAEFWEN